MRSVAIQLGLVLLLLSSGCSLDENGGDNDEVSLVDKTEVTQIHDGTQDSGSVNVADQIWEELSKLDETQVLDETQTLSNTPEHSASSGSLVVVEAGNASESDVISDADDTAELVNLSEPVEKTESVSELELVESIETPEIPEIPEIPDIPTPPEMPGTDKAAERKELENTLESDTDISPSLENAETVLFPEYVTPTDVEKCSVDDLKRRVYWDMRDYYIYSEQVPQLNLADYDSPDTLINALRISPDIYSSVQDANTQFALTETGLREGYEFWFSPANDGVVRFRHIWQGSSADKAGIKRGDEIISIDDRPIEELSNSEINIKIFSPEKAPLSLTVRTDEEASRTVLVSHDAYQWATAGPVKLIASDDKSGLPKVAYLPVNSFLKPTKNEFDTAITEILDMGGVEELIIDLRYNGGGDVNIATYMATIVGGEKVQGKEAYTNQWNNKYSSLTFTRSFDVLGQSLNLPRVIVLTTSFTASASELFINSLKPYMEVVVIGERSTGKPYSNGIFEYCGKTLNIMTVERTNSAGVSVAGGIQPDCLVKDNWETQADSIGDPHIKASIAYILGGSCK